MSKPLIIRNNASLRSIHVHWIVAREYSNVTLKIINSLVSTSKNCVRFVIWPTSQINWRMTSLTAALRNLFARRRNSQRSLVIWRIRAAPTLKKWIVNVLSVTTYKFIGAEFINILPVAKASIKILRTQSVMCAMKPIWIFIRCFTDVAIETAIWNSIFAEHAHWLRVIHQYSKIQWGGPIFLM